MRNITYLCVLLLAACSNGKQEEVAMTRLSPELAFARVAVGSGDTVREGNVLKLSVQQFYNDSLLSGPVSQYQPFDSLSLDSLSRLVFTGTRSGDSLIFEVLADSAFKGKRLPFAVKGGKIITRVKVLDILENRDSMDADRRKGAAQSGEEKW